MKIIQLLILFTLFAMSCAPGTPKEETKNATTTSNSATSTTANNSTKSKDPKSRTVAQKSVSDKSVITFDQITKAEISKNSKSNGGNNMKEPLVFEENGMKIEISNMFYLKPGFGKPLPTHSTPNSLSGGIIILKVNDGASFNFKSAMIGSLEKPKKVKLQGVRGKNTAHEEKFELKHTNFKKYEFEFDNIESLIIYGGMSGAVWDDLEIALN